MAAKAPATPKARRKLWRRVVRVLVLTLGVLVLLVIAAVGFLHSPWGREIVRGRLEGKLAEKVNGTVSIGSLDYTLLLDEIYASDISIRDASGRPAIGIARIDAVIDRASVFARDPLIESIVIHGLDLSVLKTADGRSNLTGLFKPSQGTGSLEHVRVAKLSIDGGATVTKPDGTTITISNFAVGGAVEARPLAKELDATLANLGARITISKPGAVTRQVDLVVGSATVTRRETGVDVRFAQIAAGPLTIDTLAVHAGLVGGRLVGAQELALARGRVDRAKLAALLGRDVLREDATFDVSIKGPPERLVLDGAVRTGAMTLQLDGEADAAASRPTYRILLAGDALRPSAIVTKKALPDIATDVRIEVRGAGILRGDIDAQIDLALHALAVDITGRGAITRDQTVTGTLTVGGVPVDAITAAMAAGIVVPPKLVALQAKLPPRLDATVSATGRLDGEVTVTLAPTKLAIAGGSVGLSGSAVIDHRTLRTAAAHVTLASLDLASLAALAGKPPKVRGSLGGTIDLARDGATQGADYNVSVALAKPALMITARGHADPTSASAHAAISHAGTKLATVDARLPLGKTGGKLGLVRRRGWSVVVDMARRPAADLASLVPERLRAKLPHGDVEARIAVAGTPAKPTAILSLAANDGDRRVRLEGTLAPTATGMMLATTGNVALGADVLAKITAAVAMPALFASGRLDVKALRAAATVDATVELPARSFGSLSSLRPSLARIDEKLGGQISGRITAKGPVASPLLDATVRWSDYKTAAGTIGSTELVAHGTPALFDATLTHNGALAIAVKVDRTAKDRIAIRGSAKAAKTPLLPLLPAFLAAKLPAADIGTVRSDLEGSVALVRGASGTTVEDVAVTGSLDVEGASFALPNSKRRYHDIGLSLGADPHGIRLAASAHESDIEDRDRRVEINGNVAFAGTKPAKADLAIVAHDWLVFGPQKLGKVDAPRAAADADLSVSVDLTQPIIGVEATVNSLAFRSPERFERGHWNEPMTDDIIYLEPGMTPGTLRVPTAVAMPAGDATPKKRHPIDIHVHIPEPIRVNQMPFDVTAHGELTVTVRTEGIKTRGMLRVDSGTLYLFGHNHRLVDGRLTFSDEHPKGWMDMTFERRLPDDTMRELSKATGDFRMTLAGPISKPAPTISGAAGGLEDAMAMQNAGHGVLITRPDLPASESVQVPRGDQLSVMSFLASNLPYLTFLHRISAWSDPADSPYGQIKHVEADRYTAQDRNRIRAVVRPQTPGRSSAEIQVDHMLIHDDTKAAGVGLRAGDRLGGGVGLFFEWSSKN